MLNIALPKGRLGERVYKALADAGYAADGWSKDSRKLIFESAENKVRYLLVKPCDIAIYVEHGAADLGIVGKDILAETKPDVYELLDLGVGLCRMAVAAPQGYAEDKTRVLKVATKFPVIAKDYYAALNREIELIKLGGSIELAPLAGLSDVIVDIVETGSTLRYNKLEVLNEFMPVSARLIANKSAYKFKTGAISEMVGRIQAIRDEEGQTV